MDYTKDEERQPRRHSKRRERRVEYTLWMKLKGWDVWMTSSSKEKRLQKLMALSRMNGREYFITSALI